MIKIQTAAAIRTSAEIRGFRSLKHAVGPRVRALDWGRIMQGRAQRIARADHKAWRAAQGG
jgi:hypothetical protein